MPALSVTYSAAAAAISACENLVMTYVVESTFDKCGVMSYSIV